MEAQQPPSDEEAEEFFDYISCFSLQNNMGDLEPWVVLKMIISCENHENKRLGKIIESLFKDSGSAGSIVMKNIIPDHFRPNKKKRKVRR